MTTAKQVKDIFRPILKRHPFLKETSARSISLIPVSHLVAGVFVERSAHKDYFSPYLTVMNMFRSRVDRPLCMGSYAEYLPRCGAKEDWIWSDPATIDEAIDMIETVALPKLAFLRTVEGYATLPPREFGSRYEPREDRMLVHIAVGDLDAARELWRTQEPLHRGKTYHPGSLLHRWQTQVEAVAEPLHAGDRPALARILHGWEAANVRGTEIERYWEPTPFPLEL